MTGPGALRFCVVGGGPVGRLLAALLGSGQGAGAVLVARGRALAEVRAAGGVRLLVPGEGSAGEGAPASGAPGWGASGEEAPGEVGRPVPVVVAESVTEAVAPGAHHVFVVAVKGYDTGAVARELSGLLREPALGQGRERPGFHVLTVQNGIGNEQVLAAALGEERVLSGALTAAVSLEEDGAVRVHSRRAGIGLAALALAGGLARVPAGDPAGATSLLAELAARLARPWFRAAVYPDWAAMKWSKLLLNLLGNATSALLDEPPAEALARPGVFAVERAAFLEACAVMDRLGLKAVALPGYPVHLLRAALRLPLPLARRLVGQRVAGGRGGKEPSFLLDLRRGRATEAPFLHGAVAAEARRLGLRAPVCAALDAALERAAADPGFRASLRHDPERLLAWISSYTG